MIEPVPQPRSLVYRTRDCEESLSSAKDKRDLLTMFTAGINRTTEIYIGNSQAKKS